MLRVYELLFGRSATELTEVVAQLRACRLPDGLLAGAAMLYVPIDTSSLGTSFAPTGFWSLD